MASTGLERIIFFPICRGHPVSATAINLEQKKMDSRTRMMQLILSATGLISTYQDAQIPSQSATCYRSDANYQRTASLHKELVLLVENFKQLEIEFMNILTALLEQDKAHYTGLSEVTQLLHATRKLEAVVKNTLPPETLADNHMTLRRTLANLRGRLVQIENLHRQATKLPTYVNTEIDSDGLKRLAELTTKGLEKNA